MNNTLKATLGLIVIALVSVASVFLHAQDEERNQDVYVAVYKKATETQVAPAPSGKSS